MANQISHYIDGYRRDRAAYLEAMQKLCRFCQAWHDPDRATLEIPANRAILTDEPVPYEVGE